ncbi:hypothetical protein QEL93_001233 [Pseudomonas putida]|nr:hypothetical protein [Pseudomonas putida]
MFLSHYIPSWQEIESRIINEMGYQGGAHFRTHLNEQVASLALNLRRVRAVQSAFDQAEWQAARMLRQRFADLDIASIVDELLIVVRQMAMIVASGVITGGAIGAGIGVLGSGAGAIPFAGAGAAMGLKVSGWILGVLGLASIAEFFIDGLPRIGEYYLDGICIAWKGTRGDEGLSPFSQDDPHAVSRAAHHIALGHVEVVVLLLGAIVSYLTRGRGDARVLAQEMAASRKGARLGQWMLKHEEGLKQRPDLHVPERRKGIPITQEPGQPNLPPRKDKEPSSRKPGSMPLHTVECFKADKLPASKIGEFERQLGGQEEGLNFLTVQEYLDNAANPIPRDPAAARRARKSQERKLFARFNEELSRTMDAVEAEQAALRKARKTMSNLAGLHNPDLIVGGKDVIADFGDRQVNSTIGPQWKSKIGNLTRAAESVPKAMRDTTFINVKLHKC